MPVSNPVRPFTQGRLTSGRLNEIVDTLNAHARDINSINRPPADERARGAGPLAVKVTEVMEPGRYKGLAYLPPYNLDNTDAITLDDLGQRTRQVVLWNLSEINGGTALAVGDVVDASNAGGLTSGGLAVMKTGGTGGGTSTLEARVVSYEQDGTNKRWFYTATEHSTTSAGYDGWEDDLEDLEAEGATFIAMNRLEVINGPDGQYGNGVHSDNLVGTGQDIVPIPIGTPIEVKAIPIPGDDPQYWFSIPNGTDGPCP